MEVPFPATDSTVAPHPSQFWSEELRAPYPTNAPWQNFVLNQGRCPEPVHPYVVRSGGEHGTEACLSLSYPERAGNNRFIFQCFVPNLTVSLREAPAGLQHKVTAYDDLSVTLSWGGKMRAPLARGSPYLTLLFEGVTPVFSTIHAVLNFEAMQGQHKHRLSFNNGQVWLIYSSAELALERDLRVSKPFTGTVRVALLRQPGDEDILDRHCSCYPTGGAADFSEPLCVRYRWTVESWSERCELLMLSLPIHRQILASPKVEDEGRLEYLTMDGPTRGVVGTEWRLQEPAGAFPEWTAMGGPLREGSAREEVASALCCDVGALQRITGDSSYFAGKAMARAARLAVIADELCLEKEKSAALSVTRESLTPWLDGTFQANSLLHDRVWGGVVSRVGSRDAGADFGNALYNDHHYHWGYFLYAGAVVAKYDNEWAARFKSHLYALLGDILSAVGGGVFPRLRNFDPWVLHSWAGGITEFADGRNQESTSEAVNAYYSAYLLGSVYGDQAVTSLSRTLALLECRAARTLWHIRSDSTMYAADFVAENRLVGVLWANKVDSGLWFAPAEHREARAGIQVLPVTPALELLFQDSRFVKELVEWTKPCLNRPGCGEGWKEFLYCLEGIVDHSSALVGVRALTGHDDGSSMANTLWWLHSRSR